MDFAAVAQEVETSDFASSAVHKSIGGNVKSPGLVRGHHYIIKYWSVKSTPGSDNPYWVAQFIGAGESSDKLLTETPRAKDMTSNQRYFFKRPKTGDVVGAANYAGALVVNNDNEQRITFYALLTEARQDALPLDAPNMRPDKTSAVRPAATPHEAKQLTRPEPVTDVPKSARQPRQRSEDDTTIPAERLKALFAAPPKVEYVQYFAAYFRSESDARRFAARFKDGFYEAEGFSHIALAPHAGNEEADFFGKAVAAGAFNRVNYRKPAKRPATS
jgi:hypothetical protein